MKKTKLLTSIAALALVLGLGACNEPVEDGATEESSETTQTTESSTDTETTTSENTSESTSEDNTSEDSSSDGNNQDPVHEHVYGDYVVTEEGHYQVCAECGETTAIEAHTSANNFTADATDSHYHVKTCVACGYILERAAHQVAEENGDCVYCEATGLNTSGLSYTLNSDGNSYRVTKYDMTLDAKEVYVRSTYDGKPVTAVGYSDASSNASTVFGADTTSGNSLNFIGLPDTITTIEAYSIYGCYSLVDIYIPSSVTSIGSNAFRTCYSLESITIPDSVVELGDDMFYQCYSLKSAYVSSGVTELGDAFFEYCESLTDVTLSSNIMTFGKNIFQYCYSLKSFEVPEGVTTMGNYVFGACSALESVKLPSTLTSAGTYLFQKCFSLRELVMPEGVTEIGTQTCSECYALRSIVIPSTVTSVGSSAFNKCYSLDAVYYGGASEDEWDSNVNVNSTSNAFLTNATRYYYSETEPTEEGNYWHFVNGEPVAY